MSRSRTAVLAAALFGVGTLGATSTLGATNAVQAKTSGRAFAVPHYDHVFVVIEENHGFGDVMGNPAAPNLNDLARRYGLATGYQGVAHPSEPNYVALLGGGTFGVTNDNPYYLNTVKRPSLISQLDQAHVSWKAYLQGVPHPGYQGICYPAFCNGVPDKDPLYVSKHDGIQNFTTSRNAADWSRQVPIEQLGADLRSRRVPSFGYIAPDECHDQHGDPPYCLDSGALRGSQDQRLVAAGDEYLGHLVHTITSAPFWARGNNAVVITYDEGSDNGGGGGRVATVVVTSHGPRHVTDPATYSHYSLLQTIQRTFRLGCLAATCDTHRVHSMTSLLRPAGTRASPTRALAVPRFDTTESGSAQPTATYTTMAQTSGGWSVTPAPKVGTGDNSFGAVAAVAANDVWTVGNYLPDQAPANPDATRPLAAHFNGNQWISTPTPSVGPNYGTLFGVAAVPGHAWAVGVHLDAGYNAHSLLESWDGSSWSVSATPQLDASRDILLAVSAVSGNDVWAVGEQQSRSGRFSALIEHWDGRRWTVARAANAGKADTHLTGIAAVGRDDVWAVGQRNATGADAPLVEHWNGRAWGIVRTPSSSRTGALLDAVAARSGEVWAVGQTDGARSAGRPLVEHYARGRWTASTPAVGSAFTNLLGVAMVGDTPWATGTYYDSVAGKQRTLIIRGDASGWHDVGAPSPGSGDSVLGGISGSSVDLWAVGYAKDAGSRQPLIEDHRGP